MKVSSFLWGIQCNSLTKISTECMSFKQAIFLPPVIICRYVFSGNCIMSVFKYCEKNYIYVVMCVCLCVCMYQCVLQFVCMNVSVLYCLCVLLYLCLFVCLLVCWRLYALIRRRILNERDFEETNKQTDENPSPHITNSRSNLNIASGLNPITVSIVPGGTSSSSTMGRLSGRGPSHMSR